MQDLTRVRHLIMQNPLHHVQSMFIQKSLEMKENGNFELLANKTNCQSGGTVLSSPIPIGQNIPSREGTVFVNYPHKSYYRFVTRLLILSCPDSEMI